MGAIYDLGGREVTAEDRAYAERVVTLGMGDGKHNTINLCKRAIADNVPGDFVECGVNAGGHPALMAYTIMRYHGYGRKVHLYDSFQGVPMAGPEDPPEWQKIMGVNPDPKKGIPCNRLVATLAQVQENMIKWGVGWDGDLLVYHEGWLQEVLVTEKNTPDRIAVLRVDVDLYDSTVPVFEHLYPRVSSGGYVISDDWGESEADAPCRRAVHRYFDSHGIPRPSVTRMPTTTGTVWWKKP